jgi:hypothetical protein
MTRVSVFRSIPILETSVSGIYFLDVEHVMFRITEIVFRVLGFTFYFGWVA